MGQPFDDRGVPMASIDKIFALFERFGHQDYGEGVNQLEHALQTAMLAQSEGASCQLVAAALLHDIGHFIADPDASRTDRDMGHEFAAAKWLTALFGVDVTEPIRMHVDAKRYLCAMESGYSGGLSEASRESLRLQGGPFDETAAATYMKQPFADDAIRLRRWDDAAKVVGLATPTLADFLPALQAALASQ